MNNKQNTKAFGIVKSFDPVKGIGFIFSNNKNYFFDYTNLPIIDGDFKIPNIGQTVKFVPFEYKDELLAKDIEF